VEIALARQDAVDARRWMALADAGLSGNELSGAGPSDAGPAAAKAFETLTRPRLLARAEVALIGRTDPGGPYGTGADSILIETSGQLRHWLSTHAADAAAWSALARLEQAQGHTLRSLRAHAEAQAARGDLDGAIERLQAAQSSLRAPPVTRGDSPSSNASRIDFIEASVIDARLRHWLALRQQRANEFRRGTAGSR
jgi:hypothetical protein